MRAALRQILSAHHRVARPSALCDMVIDILTCVGFVVHEEIRIAEAEILNEYDVARQLAFAQVMDFDPPQPQVRMRMQPKLNTMLYGARRSLPNKAVVSRADPRERLWAGDRQDRRPGAANPKKQAPHAAADRRAQHLIDHHSPIFLCVLDGEDRAVGKQADRKSRPVDDFSQAKLVLPRRCERRRRSTM